MDKFLKITGSIAMVFIIALWISGIFMNNRFRVKNSNSIRDRWTGDWYSAQEFKTKFPQYIKVLTGKEAKSNTQSSSHEIIASDTIVSDYEEAIDTVVSW